MIDWEGLKTLDAKTPESNYYLTIFEQQLRKNWPAILAQHEADKKVIEAALDLNTLRYGAWIGSIELDDGVYHGKILHIKDLVVYEAEVKARLPEAFENAVHDYIQTCIELGDDNKMITSLQALAEFEKAAKL